MLKRALLARWRATPLYYFLRRILVPLCAHSYFGTAYFPAAAINCFFFMAIGGLVIGGAMGAQENRLAAQERRMDRQAARILQNQKQIVELRENVALLPSIAKEQEELKKTMIAGFDNQAAWHTRALWSIMAVLAACLTFFLRPHFRHRKNGVPRPAKP